MAHFQWYGSNIKGCLSPCICCGIHFKYVYMYMYMCILGNMPKRCKDFSCGLKINMQPNAELDNNMLSDRKMRPWLKPSLTVLTISALDRHLWIAWCKRRWSSCIYSCMSPTCSSPAHSRSRAPYKVDHITSRQPDRMDRNSCGCPVFYCTERSEVICPVSVW